MNITQTICRLFGWTNEAHVSLGSLILFWILSMFCAFTMGYAVRNKRIYTGITGLVVLVIIIYREIG